MAHITFSGTDNLSIGLAQLAKLSDEDVWRVLESGAKVLETAHEDALRKKFKQHTGDLAKSPTIVKKYIGGSLVARIQPQGKHSGSSRGVRKRSRARTGIKYAKHGRAVTAKYQATNAEIAYILEYGSPRIKATHWMEYANEEAEGDFIKAEERAWNELLTEKGL